MMTLYYAPGACSLAVRVVLEELAIPYRAEQVNMAEGDHRKPEYLAVNPRGRVPALRFDGQIYTETPALLMYLAACSSKSRLLPETGTLEFVRCLEWLAWLSSSLHVAYVQHWLPERFLASGAPDGGFREQGKRNIAKMNIEIEDRLIGPWALGENYSVVDAYLLVFYRWGNGIGLPMKASCPRWTAWAQRMKERAAVRCAAANEGILILGQGTEE